MSEEIITNQAVTTGGNMTLKGVVDRVNMVHQVLKKVMKKGTHFGTVPGCGARMVLLKPGADLLAMTFRLAPEYRISRHEMDGGHREYEVTCIMRGPDGNVIGEGVGSGSTMEKKYRYRKDDGGKKIENEDIADVYNTVLKMAKKRAHIDATLTCTGSGDMFTQDLIDEDDAQQAERAPVKPPIVTQQQTAQDPTPQPGELVTVGNIEDVQIKSGGTKEKPWKKYGIRIGGMTLGTFDTAIGEEAQAAIGVKARVHYEVKGKYMTVTRFELLENTDAEPVETVGSDDYEKVM